ncbi:Aminodeoxychorismate synthase component 1 [Corynebacterium occultum]|uniref:aminodeoxychorismate synthase n=1 Tax=Corynebacterium occultum TaxID=2675219 RepID=A0A6B8W9P3_9CORY|nr:chorismate-binding protein [Corynebacterium occultum]QGU07995.1 Aminodeoxychorismate synthase component 1 [Corynebacterium occultum]
MNSDSRIPPSLLLIDNHDSFTGILAHLIQAATGTAPGVLLHDDPRLTPALIAAQDCVVISPGPGNPHNPDDLRGSALALAQDRVPVLGVCLGMQAIAVAAGARVSRAAFPMHGRSSRIDGFAGLPGPLEVTRYHSLAVDPASVGENLKVTSRAEDGTIMALSRLDAPQVGVQFHPESVGTVGGELMIRALLRELGVNLPPRVRWHSQLLSQVSLSAVAAVLDPLARSLVWLDSSDAVHPTGRSSFLAADLGSGESGIIAASLLEERLAQLPQVEVTGGGPYRPGVFWSLDYEAETAMYLCPDVLVQETREGTWLYTREGVRLPALADLAEPVPAAAPVTVGIPRADHSLSGYLAAVEACQQHIRAGESYELCLTTTVRTRLAEEPEPLGLYLRLRKLAPAPMASFWRVDGVALLSASPERFMSVDGQGMVSASPIKGTRPRGVDKRQDEGVRAELQASVKDRAENQMIVDLMRHDIAAWCEPGSVQVPELCAVHSFATGHQMISTVTGRLHPGVPVHQVIHAAFPPGSMTGAPKERTMALLETLEPGTRGWYSGVAGHLSADGVVDTAVLIRTAVVSGKELSYGAGGAVTMLSDPAEEAAEVQVKLLPLRRLLGIADNADDWLEDWT